MGGHLELVKRTAAPLPRTDWMDSPSLPSCLSHSKNRNPDDVVRVLFLPAHRFFIYLPNPAPSCHTKLRKNNQNILTIYQIYCYIPLILTVDA